MSDSGIKLLNRYAHGQGAVFEDVVRYYRKLKQKEVLTIATNCYRSLLFQLTKQKEDTFIPELIRGAASSICHFVAMTHAGLTRKDLSESIFSLPEIKQNNGIRQIKNLYLHGEFPPMQFSNIEIWDSEFVGYENFTKSRFENAKFLYSNFSGISGQNRSPTFDQSLFDESTCHLGELQDILNSSHLSNESHETIHVDEFKRFFKRFFDAGAFHYKKSDDLYNFSTFEFNSLILELLINEDVLVTRSRNNIVEYGVTTAFQRSVQKLLSEGSADRKLRGILKKLSTS